MPETESPDAALNAGIARHQAGDLAAAESAYRRVLAALPEHAGAMHLMGLVAKHRGDLDTAVAWMEAALARNPDFAEAHYNLGNTRWLRGETETAVACYDRALVHKPGHEDAWVNKGRSLQQLGRRDAAAEAFRAATRVNPDSGKAWENLTFTRHFAPDDEAVAAMRAALDRVVPGSDDAKCLHFALGKARTDQGNGDAGFGHYMAGNGVARLLRPHDVSDDERLFAHIGAQATAERLAALAGGGDGSPRPVFILGMPRAGTTLVEQILASHPRVAPGGERQDLADVVGNTRLAAAGEAGFPQWLPHLERDHLAKLAQAYLGRLPALAEGQDRVTDKMPNNFRFLGLIHRILPHAAIIHVHRSPVATCLSCYTQNFTRGHGWSFDQASLGRYYRAYSQLMQHWRAGLPAGAFLDVRYEDVVTEPETQVARLLDYCGLDWDDRCLRFHETERAVKTASMEQVRQPLYTGAIDKWRRYAPFLGPLLSALGVLAVAAPDTLE